MTFDPTAAARIDEQLGRQLDGRVPGAAVAVLHAGEPVLTNCFGVADLEWGNPVTPATVFRVASLTKPFTALTVLLLAADGLLDLDAPITEYLPGYAGPGARVLVRQLLSHTSGIPNFVTQADFSGTGSRLDHTDAEVVAIFAGLPLDFEPGSRYAYSNSGYRLLDMIVASATGTGFAEVVAERVFTPAGMHDTRLLSDEAIVPRRAHGYQRGRGGFVNANYVSMTVPGGAGGVGSTLADLQRFDRALTDGVLAGGGLWETLSTPVRLTGGRTEDYGLGWAFNTYRGRRVMHHAGGIEGFSCIYLRIPEEDTSVIVLTNLEGFRCGVVAVKLIDAVLALPAIEQSRVDLRQSTMEERVGDYADTINVVRVSAEPGRLVVTMGDQTHRMVPVDATAYVDESNPDITLQFHDGEAEPACTLRYPLWWITGYRKR